MILNEFKEELIMNYNKNISVEADSIYEGLYEYYVNDYIVFENILKRDYLEIAGVLTEADNRNFLQRFWDKIIQLIETIKQKVSVLIDKVTIKIDENKIKSLTKKLNKNKDLIEKTCLYNFPIDEFNQPDTAPIDDLKRDNDEFFSHAKVLDHNGKVVNSWEYLEEAAKSKKSSSIKDRLKKLIPDLDI